MFSKFFLKKVFLLFHYNIFNFSLKIKFRCLISMNNYNSPHIFLEWIAYKLKIEDYN